jgi:hypothetical protein
VYDYDEDDLAELGWERFVTMVWESIFVGYHRFTGIRTIARRWSDLLQGGLSCPAEVADELVRLEVIEMEVRSGLSSKDPATALAAMDEVMADMDADLAELEWVPADESSRLRAGLGRLRTFLAAGQLAD